MSEWETKISINGTVKLTTLHEPEPFATEYVTLAEAERKLEEARSICPQAKSYFNVVAVRRCDIPACNCGSFQLLLAPPPASEKP